MRTLLIDNYDSFTFNVAQAIAQVSGIEPVVIKNDEYAYGELLGLEFDNIVISPGPGSPDNDRDFGVCGAVVRHATCPVLGICMGFQGIALVEGSRVVPAPEPWHGRGCFISHSGTDLFEGIPSPFFGIRYHSLHVPSLDGTDLVETARTDDGILMAFGHVRRPVWGVQFHPESISTEYGRRIFENFRDLSLRKVTPKSRQSRATNPHSKHVGSDSLPPSLEVRFRKLTDAPSAERVFAQLYTHRKPAVWLDSNAVVSGRARFSFMADASHPRDQVLRYHSRIRRLEIESESGTVVVNESIFDHLKAALSGVRVDTSDLPFDFCGGYVGYFGYELKGECGGQYRHDSELPDALFIRVSRFVAFDHATAECYVVAVGGAVDDLKWIDMTAARIEHVDALAQTTRHARSREPDFRLEQDRPRYLTSIGVALERIAAGESYQVCLTNRARGRFDGDPFGLYQILRRRNPAPFSAFLNCEDFSVLCSSPERFLRIRPDGSVEARPIKGTSPRSSDPDEDVRFREDLLHSEKNRSENLMIADLLRNDLGRTAKIGSVHVPSLMALESYETVHHLVSTIEAQLSSSHDGVDCIRSAFPGGSMTGAPKTRTMETIDELESSARGVYSGAMGYLSYSGAVDLNIVIRTMVIASGAISMGMGGGVVALSDPGEEFDEALLKGKALMEAVEEYSRSDARAIKRVGRD